jgi:hypothetical protein
MTLQVTRARVRHGSLLSSQIARIVMLRSAGVVSQRGRGYLDKTAQQCFEIHFSSRTCQQILENTPDKQGGSYETHH